MTSCKKEDKPIERVLSPFSWTCAGDTSGGEFKLYVNESQFSSHMVSDGSLYEGSIGEINFYKAASSGKVKFTVYKYATPIFNYSDSTNKIIIKRFFLK